MRQATRYIGLFFLVFIYAPTGLSESGTQLSSLIQSCNDCHGPNGVSAESDMPTIAGLSSFFFDEQMRAYRDAARPCMKSKYRAGDLSRAPADMCELSKDLSDAVIEELSLHYEEQKFVAAKQPVELVKAVLGKAIHDKACDKCHTEAGSVAEDDAGVLAGQWTPYLQQSFDEYRAGTRPDIKKMTAAFDKLSDADFVALIHYYACMGNVQAGELKASQCGE